MNGLQVYGRTSMNRQTRAIIGWVFYDWANSAFALTVLAAFFPVFFRNYWSGGAEAAFTTTKLGMGNAVAGLLIAVLSPLMGALADAGRRRKSFLMAFMLTGVAVTSLLGLVGQGWWKTALAVFIVANIGWSCANLFYDSLLPAVAGRERMDFVSSLGYSVGYLGCALLFVLNIVMVSKPALFGLESAAQAVKLSFVTVSGWWLIFSLPLFIFVREDGGAQKESGGKIILLGLRQLVSTLGEIRRRRHVWLFLVAYWLYIDGVDTFIRMAADLGLSIGLDSGSLMVSLLIVQLVAFPSALLFGLLAHRIGAYRSILLGIGLYIIITVVGPLWVRTDLQYRIVAMLSALPLGCLQALSRSYFARIVPQERTAQYFGFYNLMGKFAAIFGPALVAVVAFACERYGAGPDRAARLGFCSISLLFISGGFLLMRAVKARNE